MGWNSTKNGSKWQTMPERFNSQWDGILPGKECKLGDSKRSFNSQWDGILPFLCLASAYKRRRFNSQWDGILRIFVVFHFYSLSVSIPNGMEFYI